MDDLRLLTRSHIAINLVRGAASGIPYPGRWLKKVLSFIDAEAKHTELLRDTLISSKGYWGYSQELLEQWSWRGMRVQRKLLKVEEMQPGTKSSDPHLGSGFIRQGRKL